MKCSDCKHLIRTRLGAGCRYDNNLLSHPNNNCSRWEPKVRRMTPTDIEEYEEEDYESDLQKELVTKTELEPYPFCGKNAELKHYKVNGDDWWYVACKHCEIALDPLFWNADQTKEEVMKKWNRRVKETRDCLNCSASFSDDAENGTMILRCAEHDWKVVSPDDYCDKWN